jgi:hypothetical protein
MNQHDFVEGCLAFYEEERLTPEKGWDKAHYPAPKDLGESTVWMTHNHHQHQGLLQSREYGQCCFHNGDVYRFLTEGPFVPGWFELWDIYDEYKGFNGKLNAAALNAHFNTRAARISTQERRTAAMNAHPNTTTNRLRNSKKHNERTSKPVICVESGTVYPSVREAARETGSHQPNIRSCCAGKRQTAGGLHWKFA